MSYNFKYYPLPKLILNKKISWVTNQNICERWSHTITVKQCSNKIFIIYPTIDGCAVLIFKQNCLILYRTFEINHSLKHCMTAIYSYAVSQTHILLCFGFDDGFIQICSLRENINKNISVLIFKKLINFSLEYGAITGIKSLKNDLCFCHNKHITVLKEFIKDYSQIDNQQNENKKQQYYENIKLKLYRISIEKESIQGFQINSGTNLLYVFNEIKGLKIYSANHYKVVSEIIDNVVAVCQLNDLDIAMADCRDNLKIYYHGERQVDKFSGFKNYVSCIYHRNINKRQQIWVADLNGCVSLFIRKLKKQKEQLKKQLQLYEEQLPQLTRILDTGIKQIIVTSTMLILLDCQNDIYIYDIIEQNIHI